MISNLLKLQAQLKVFTQEVERHAVIRCSSVLPYRRTVFLGGIAFVLVPIVEWMFLVQGIHVVIAIGLRQNGCRSYGKIFSIAPHHRRMWQILILLKTICFILSQVVKQSACYI